MSLLLPPFAESLRREIKELVAEAIPKEESSDETATVFIEDERGVRSYEGGALAETVTRLITHTSMRQEWGWEVMYFPIARALCRYSKHMCVIALTEGVATMPRGTLYEGNLRFLPERSVIESGSTVLCLGPLWAGHEHALSNGA